MSEPMLIPVKAADLRLWRDTIRGEKTAVEDGEEPFLQQEWSDSGVSLADRIIAAIETYLIASDADWSDDEAELP